VLVSGLVPAASSRSSRAAAQRASARCHEVVAVNVQAARGM
jgi:hypothetical protein